MNTKQLISPAAAIFSLLCYTLPFYIVSNDPLVSTFSRTGLNVLTGKLGYLLLPEVFLSLVIAAVPFLIKNKQGALIVIVASSICILLSFILIISLYHRETSFPVSKLHLDLPELEFNIGIGFYGAICSYFVALIGGFLLNDVPTNKSSRDTPGHRPA
jgi:hypothetical protein